GSVDAADARGHAHPAQFVRCRDAEPKLLVKVARRRLPALLTRDQPDRQLLLERLLRRALVRHQATPPPNTTSASGRRSTSVFGVRDPSDSTSASASSTTSGARSSTDAATPTSAHAARSFSGWPVRCSGTVIANSPCGPRFTWPPASMIRRAAS